MNYTIIDAYLIDSELKGRTQKKLVINYTLEEEGDKHIHKIVHPIDEPKPEEFRDIIDEAMNKKHLRLRIVANGGIVNEF